MLDFAYKQKGAIFMKGLAINTENQMQFKDFGEPLLDNLQKEVGLVASRWSSQVSAGRTVHGD